VTWWWYRSKKKKKQQQHVKLKSYYLQEGIFFRSKPILLSQPLKKLRSQWQKEELRVEAYK
jgi:hypothetical protein